MPQPLLIIVGLLGAAATPVEPVCPSTVVERVKPLMGTYVSIQARGCDGQVEGAVEAAFGEMRRLAAMLSEWEPESAVSRLSDAAGIGPVPVPSELYDVLAAGLEASALTAGSFDVTWAALRDLWRFDGSAVLPAPTDVERRRLLVGDRDLALDPIRRTAYLKRAGMRVGLGGLAKGYIAAAAADLLVARGVKDVLVSASGDIAARGRNGDRPWVVAVRDPRHRDRAVATVELRDESISTAGDYEHAFFVGGRRYHHILDPRTGYPAQSGTASVSVVSRSGVQADALDTGLLVLGRAKGTAVATAIRGIGALFIDEDGSLEVAGEGSKRFDLLPPDKVAGPRRDQRLGR